jgi:hypothetical protein
VWLPLGRIIAYALGRMGAYAEVRRFVLSLMVRICSGSASVRQNLWLPTLIGLLLTGQMWQSACGLTRTGESQTAAELTVVPRAGLDPRLVSAILTVHNHGGGRSEIAFLDIQGEMAHPGMGPAIGILRQTAPDTYVADIRLTMSGEWTVVADGMTVDGRRIFATQKYIVR